MANPGAMKNWEAQARTNSVLAGSLKALEERVEDLSDLLEWCVRLPDGSSGRDEQLPLWQLPVFRGGRLHPCPCGVVLQRAAAFGWEAVL